MGDLIKARVKPRVEGRGSRVKWKGRSSFSSTAIEGSIGGS